MTRLKDATYEAGSLTGSDGATSSSGTVTLDTTSKVKGVNSVFINTVPSFQRYDVTASDDIYLSLYVYIGSMSQNIRTIYITNSLRLDFRSTGKLRLADSAGTAIGSDSATLSFNTLYRIGLHWRKATIAGNDGIGEAWVTTAGHENDAFGSPFASSSALTQTAQASRVDIGNTSGALSNAFYHDNVRIDNSAMPTDDVAGGTNTAKTITVTSTASFVAQKNIGLPRSIVSSVTASIQRAINITKSLAITSTVSVAKARAILISLAVATTKTVTKSLPRTITYAVSTTLVAGKGFANTISIAVTSTVIFAKGMVTLKTITLAVSTTKSALKNIGKPIQRAVTTTIARNTTIPKNVLVSVTPILFIKKDFFKIITRTITSTLTAVVGKGYLKTINVAVTISSVIQKNILKPIVVTQTVVASVGPKSIAKTITRTISMIVSSTHGNLVLKTIQYIATVSVSKNASVGKTFLYVENTIVSMQKSLSLLISSSVQALTLPSVQKNILFTRTVFVNAIISFGKVLSNQLTNTYLRKNVRSLTLQTKNTALNVVGKNTSTIDLKDTNES